MKTVAMAVIAGVSVAASGASAEGLFNLNPAPSGFYISGFGGVSLARNSSFDGVSAPEPGVPGPIGVAGAPVVVGLDYSAGYTYGGAVGYQLPVTYFRIFHPRLEIEVSYLKNDVDGGALNGVAQSFTGDQDALLFYVNNYSDIRFSADQKLVPYIGGGFGIGLVDSAVLFTPAGSSSPTFGIVDEDTALAGHFAIGLSYAVTPRAELYSEGRYFRVRGLDLDQRFIDSGAGLFAASLHDSLDGFTLAAGFRVRF